MVESVEETVEQDRDWAQEKLDELRRRKESQVWDIRGSLNGRPCSFEEIYREVSSWHFYYDESVYERLWRADKRSEEYYRKSLKFTPAPVKFVGIFPEEPGEFRLDYVYGEMADGTRVSVSVSKVDEILFGPYPPFELAYLFEQVENGAVAEDAVMPTREFMRYFMKLHCRLLFGTPTEADYQSYLEVYFSVESWAFIVENPKAGNEYVTEWAENLIINRKL